MASPATHAPILGQVIVLEKSPNTTRPIFETNDIEHVVVRDDPRQWSDTRKNVTLFIIAFAAMLAGLAGNIQNPAIEQMESRLHASASQISWSISIYILVQGNAPLIWTAISEIKGRKMVYIASIATFIAGSIVIAISTTIEMVIGFRCLQAAGSSAVLAIGAATLADIFEPSERGTKLGVYYMAPLLGPSLGPIFGGVLTQSFDWRAPFWFLVISGGTSFLSFLLFFKDTFRRERSRTYQNVLKQRASRRLHNTPTQTSLQGSKAEETATVSDNKKTDSEAHPSPTAAVETPSMIEVKLSLADVNPVKPVWPIVRRRNNIIILIPSGLLFGFNFNIVYTCTRTLGSAYRYNALQIGLVLLSYGIGSLMGSILGGAWSDRVVSRMQAENDGRSYPEMRLRATIFGLLLLPPSVVGFAWVCEQHVHVSAICVMLFLCGFFSIWMYTSTLAYIVDANNGRSSTAVATNSCFRGIAGFVATEIAVPLQDAVGDGWMYTIWAVLLVIGELLILLVMWKGQKWREAAEAKEIREAEKADG